MDKLEEYIRKNRGELDRYSPPKGIWKRISRKLKKENPLLRQWLSLAAMLIIILGTALVFFRPEYRWSDSNKRRATDDEITQLTPQLKETEAYYNNLSGY